MVSLKGAGVALLTDSFIEKALLVQNCGQREGNIKG